MILETERLVLREPREDDVDAWAAMFAHPDVERQLGRRTRDDTLEHIRVCRERHAADGFGPLERKEDGRVVGRAGLLVWDTRTWTPTTLREAGAYGEVEIGCTLAPDCWSRGYATEAAAACRDFALGVLGCMRVISLIDATNDRSIAVAQRLGLAYEHDVLQRGRRLIGLYALNAPAR